MQDRKSLSCMGDIYKFSMNWGGVYRTKWMDKMRKKIGILPPTNKKGESTPQ